MDSQIPSRNSTELSHIYSIGIFTKQRFERIAGKGLLYSAILLVDRLFMQQIDFPALHFFGKRAIESGVNDGIEERSGDRFGVGVGVSDLWSEFGVEIFRHILLLFGNWLQYSGGDEFIRVFAE